MSSIYSPAPVTNINDMKNPIPITYLRTFFLETSNLPWILDTTTSIIDILELSPANIRHKKNMAPNIPFIPGNALIAFGNTTKARPIPPAETSDTGTPCWAAI